MTEDGKAKPTARPPEERVLSYIREEELVRRGEQLLVAVSGGPDSVCLLHMLAGMRRDLDITLTVAHLDHQLRGLESEADAAYVTELARRLGLPAVTETLDVRQYQRQRRISLEEAAREARYAFLSRAAEAIGVEAVAVGHTADDNVETILMHLIRGSGTAGLRGLQARSRWPYGNRHLTIIRPLLVLTRQETAEYCRRHRLDPRLDTSNLSLSLMRNRIRLHLLPLLEEYNPKIREALLRTARIATDDTAFLQDQTSALWRKVAEMWGDAVVLDRKGLRSLPAALQRQLLREAILVVGGSLKDIEARHIERVMGGLDMPSGRMIELPGRLLFTVEHHRYVLGQDAVAAAPLPPLEGETRLSVPGETLIPGWRVVGSLAGPGEEEPTGDRFVACLDFERAGAELTLRSRRAGDRFWPTGMPALKKLGEFMIDAHIPRAWRDRVPIICSPAGIVWVAGWRVDERAAVTEHTRQVLRLEMERTDD